MQKWFEGGAVDGFSLAIESYHDRVDAFVDQVVLVLQERGLFHLDYEGPTVRDHHGTMVSAFASSPPGDHTVLLAQAVAAEPGEGSPSPPHPSKQMNPHLSSMNIRSVGTNEAPVPLG